MAQTRLRRLSTDTGGDAAAWGALREQVKIVLRPIGTPAALGFFGLAGGAFVVSALQLGWIDAGESPLVAVALVGFSFPALLLASILSFLARDGVMATAMGVLAFVWLVVGLALFTFETSNALGFFLVFAGIALLLTALAASLGRVVPALVFALAGVFFLATGAHELATNESWEDAAGIVGLGVFGLALYAALAALLSDAEGYERLPLGRRGRGKRAEEGSLLDQLRDANEPGVREQL